MSRVCWSLAAAGGTREGDADVNTAGRLYPLLETLDIATKKSYVSAEKILVAGEFPACVGC